MWVSDKHPDRERLLNPSAPPADSGRRLATFDRGQGTELRVNADEFKGRPFVRLQVWEKGNGGMWPVRGKMATVRMGELAELIQALVDLEREEAPEPRRDRQGGSTREVAAASRGRGPAPATSGPGVRTPPPDRDFDEF